MRRMILTNLEKMKSIWVWNKAHDKVIKDSRDDIDWFRYQKNVLLLLLILFALKCQKKRLDTMIMKNKVSTHVFKWQNSIFEDANILRLIWCENNLDLNQIEFCWWWMKRKIKKRDENLTLTIQHQLIS